MPTVPPRPRDKTAKLEAVAECIARLLIQHGPERVTHARVARAGGVSRAWLYKYLGAAREDLLRFTAVHFGNLLAEFDERPRTSSKAEWLSDTLDGLRSLTGHAERHPWVLPLYFRYVGTNTHLGRIIGELEITYIETPTDEMRRALNLDPATARWAAELLFCARMALAHRHQISGALAPAQLDQLARFLERL